MPMIPLSGIPKSLASLKRLTESVSVMPILFLSSAFKAKALKSQIQIKHKISQLALIKAGRIFVILLEFRFGDLLWVFLFIYL